MIVDAESLDVSPIADELLRAADGGSDYTGDVERGPITWSNELVSHVLEFKTTGPVVSTQLSSACDHFVSNVQHANALLKRHSARLMPTAMHPWMNPEAETKLWPHDYAEVYQAFDRLFNCRRHGWANLQSIHVNLSFSGDEEFARLHAAVRLLLPILPAVAASSPVMDGQATGVLDNRLQVYRTNSEGTASFAGRVIPEPVFSEAEYRDTIYAPIIEDLRRIDPEGALQPEFSNARGAIARFERGSLEIRLLDMQECPAADLTIAALVVRVLEQLVTESWCSLEEQKAWSIERLEPILLHCIRDADGAVISDPDYLRMFTWPATDQPVRARDLWIHLARKSGAAEASPTLESFFRTYETSGCLSRRILSRLLTPADLKSVYRSLAECLADNALFE